MPTPYAGALVAVRDVESLRRRVQARVLRLPVSFFDSTQSGMLIQRVMSDAEGVRNLVGTGIVQLIGSMITATFALGVLFWINWRLTTATLAVIGLFGGVMAYAFKKLRPIFRDRSKIYAEVSGRLGQALGGARVVKVYTAEKREEKVFAVGAHRLFRNIASTITGTSAVTTVGTLVVGLIGLLMIVIGGPDGLDPSIKAGADETLRLSDLTLPHAMVRVLLVEQLYRGWSILAKHPYHRE